MKKILFILSFSLIACKKVEVIPTPPPVNVKIFSVKESSVDNGQEIQFNLTQNGVYIMTIGDSVTNQVLTRERFTIRIRIFGNPFSIKL